MAVAVVVEEEVAAAVVEIGKGVEEETKKDWDIHYHLFYLYRNMISLGNNLELKNNLLFFSYLYDPKFDKLLKIICHGLLHNINNF